jgi:hypothetical protein
MASNSAVEDAKNWRGRAMEARFVAQQMSDPMTRLIMLEIARGYDPLAQHAEGRAPLFYPAVCASARNSN